MRRYPALMTAERKRRALWLASYILTHGHDRRENMDTTSRQVRDLLAIGRALARTVTDEEQ